MTELSGVLVRLKPEAAPKPGSDASAGAATATAAVAAAEAEKPDVKSIVVTAAPKTRSLIEDMCMLCNKFVGTAEGTFGHKCGACPVSHALHNSCIKCPSRSGDLTRQSYVEKLFPLTVQAPICTASETEEALASIQAPDRAAFLPSNDIMFKKSVTAEMAASAERRKKSKQQQQQQKGKSASSGVSSQGYDADSGDDDYSDG